MAAQYCPRVDAVIYGDAARTFTRADWLRLAEAALDQCGRDAVTMAAATTVSALAAEAETEESRA